MRSPPHLESQVRPMLFYRSVCVHTGKQTCMQTLFFRDLSSHLRTYFSTEETTSSVRAIRFDTNFIHGTHLIQTLPDTYSLSVLHA